MSELRRVRIDELSTDSRYQRGKQESTIRLIVRKPDERRLGVIEVSQRNDGSKIVFDGQNRVEALRRIGWPDIRAIVHTDLTPEEEAELWTALNRDRKQPKAIDIFKAALFARDPQAVELDHVAREAGFEIGPTGSGTPNIIEAVQALQKIRDTKRGAEVLPLTLATAQELWGGDPGVNNGEFLRGLSILVRDHAPLSKSAKERLQTMAPQTYIRRAKARDETYHGGGGLATAIANELRKTARLRVKPPASKPQEDE